MKTPEIDEILTVTVPGERLRASVEKVVRNNQIICKIHNVPQMKDHRLRQGDLIAVKNARNAMGVPEWIMVKDEELRSKGNAAKAG